MEVSFLKDIIADQAIEIASLNKELEKSRSMENMWFKRMRETEGCLNQYKALGTVEELTELRAENEKLRNQIVELESDGQNHE